MIYVWVLQLHYLIAGVPGDSLIAVYTTEAACHKAIDRLPPQYGSMKLWCHEEGVGQ